MKVIVSSVALTSRGALCSKTKANCINMQVFNKFICECYCPFGRRGPIWGCDSNELWNEASCDCACKATIPAAGCGLGQWDKKRCACYCPRPNGPTPSDKTWATHPTCAYVCKNPKPANLPTVKRWNDDKCKVECIPTKPDPIPAGKRWCEDCCELSCIAKPPCSYAIPENKHWSTEKCSVVCKESPPNDIPANKQWNSDTCSVVCRDSAPNPIPSGQQWNTNTCTLESTCTKTKSDCVYQQTLDPSTCSCQCKVLFICLGGQKANYDLCGCFSDTIGWDECLYPGDRIISQSGCFYLLFEASGNAVLHKKDGTVIWSTGTSGGSQICLQSTGNFMVSKGNDLLWQTETAGTAAETLVLQNNGDLKLLGPSGEIFWSSNTIQSDQMC